MSKAVDIVPAWLLVMATAFQTFIFYWLWASGGEITIYEPREWLRVLELAVALSFLLGAVAWLVVTIRRKTNV